MANIESDRALNCLIYLAEVTYAPNINRLSIATTMILILDIIPKPNMARYLSLSLSCSV